MDLTGWLEYFSVGLETQMEQVKERGKKAIQSDLVGKQYDLNERQKTAIFYLLGKGEIDIGIFEGLRPETNRRTLQRDIKDLLKKGLIEPIGATHRKRYILITNKI